MNWIKANKEVFNEYGIDVSSDRQLLDGQYIKHYETSNNMLVLCHMDNRVTLYTNDALVAYLEFVEGNGEE